MSVVFQPEFDARNLTLGNSRNQLRRGQIWRDPATTVDNTLSTANGSKTTVSNIQWGFQFLYNPSTLTLGFNMDASLYPPGVLQPTNTTDGSGSKPGGADKALKLLGPGSSTLSFELLLDRTYECWGGRSANDAPRFRHGLDINRTRGIMVDFEHWNAMMGYTEDSPFVISLPVFLSFGNRDGNFYYGYISAYNFGVASWTQELIPNRGGISGISFQILPLSQSTKDTNSRGPGSPAGFKQGISQQGSNVTSDMLPDSTAANPGITPALLRSFSGGSI